MKPDPYLPPTSRVTDTQNSGDKTDPLLKNLFFSAMATFLGICAGYFLWVPVIDIPIELGLPPLRPFLLWITPFFQSRNAGYVLTAIVIFFMHLPNTLAISLAFGFGFRSFSRRRLVFYAVYAWPFLIYLIYWIDAWRLKAGAHRLGISTDIARLPTDVSINYKSVLILLTYVSFTFIVYFIFRHSNRLPRDVPRNPASEMV